MWRLQKVVSSNGWNIIMLDWSHILKIYILLSDHLFVNQSIGYDPCKAGLLDVDKMNQAT